MKRFASLLMVLALGATTTCSWAHGGLQPQHGGVVQTASDLQFELVNSDAGVTLYVMDHGKPKSTEGASGKLTMLSKGKKAEVPLVASGGNTLKAVVAKLLPGTKAVASLTFSPKQTISVRFLIK
jgi:hypothetical protein